MAFAILGTPNPQFFDSSGSPLASGTLAVLDPADDTNKASYPTYDDAEAATNANSNPITLDARGSCALWGLDGEDYKLTLKDVNGDTVTTTDDIFLPASDQASLGAILYPRNAAEISAGVTPVNYNYDVGNVLRYATNTTPGTTDMSTAIQNAVDSSLLVYFPPGTYLCQTAITFRSNVHIYGYGATVQTDGTNYIFKAVGSIGTLSATTADTARGDTTFAAAAGTGSGYTDGWFMQSEANPLSAAATHKAGELGVVTSVSTDTVTIQGLFKDGYTTANTAKAAPVTFLDNITIEGLKLTNTKYDSAATTVTNSLIYYEFVKNSTVKNCTLYENNGAGALYFNVLNCSFVGNHVERMRDNASDILGYGIEVGFASQGVSITGNTFSRCRHGVTTGTGTVSSLTPAYGVQRAISIIGNTAANCTSVGLDTHEDSDGVTISSNSITGCTPAGIQTRSYRTTITGNTITSCEGKGVRLDSTAPGSVVSGNTIRGIGVASSDGFGIECDAANSQINGNFISQCGADGIVVNANGVGVSGNYVTDCGQDAGATTGHGIVVNSGALRMVNITGNTCTNNGSATAGDGININRGGAISRLTVVGNTCTDDQGGSATQDYGFQIASGTTTSVATCIVAHNNFTTNETASYINGGTAKPREHLNIGWATEANGTGSIASGTTADLITHGLDVTPTAADITVTLTENPTNSPGAIWVDTIGATTFTVNCENDPGASNLDFSWQARIY